MTLRSPKPSIREMKKAIIDAGLETEDLVERSHVEERYEEALALQPREVDQSSSKAKGMAQAAALQKKASEAPPKERPPAQNESGWWRMEDLSISASHCVETPSRHRRASSPGMMEVGGLFFDFEAIRCSAQVVAVLRLLRAVVSGPSASLLLRESSGWTIRSGTYHSSPRGARGAFILASSSRV